MAVTYFPSNTTRSPVGSTPSALSSSWASQCVVARRPSRTPAAARIREPVQTEVVQVLVSSAVRSQARTSGSPMVSRESGPPGTSTMSGRGTSARVLSATRARLPWSLRTGPVSLATKTVSAPGMRARSSYGPTASSVVKPG